MATIAQLAALMQGLADRTIAVLPKTVLITGGRIGTIYPHPQVLAIHVVAVGAGGLGGEATATVGGGGGSSGEVKELWLGHQQLYDTGLQDPWPTWPNWGRRFSQINIHTGSRVTFPNGRLTTVEFEPAGPFDPPNFYPTPLVIRAHGGEQGQNGGFAQDPGAGASGTRWRTAGGRYDVAGEDGYNRGGEPGENGLGFGGGACGARSTDLTTSLGGGGGGGWGTGSSSTNTGEGCVQLTQYIGIPQGHTMYDQSQWPSWL